MKTIATVAGLVLGVLGLTGCGTTSGVTLTGVKTSATLTMTPPLAVYRFADKNTADVYMTDLPREVFDAQADLTGISGQLTHVHLFVAPEAGRTPIDDTACSVTVRHIVIAQGQIGIYGGGGFMYPSRRPGREQFKGSITGATLRLVAATPGFEDKLGAAELAATVKSVLDEPMAGALAERLRTLVEQTTPLLREEPKPAAKKPEDKNPEDKNPEDKKPDDKKAGEKPGTQPASK
jgi:hypothetical protein